jgi:hypothetical protein
MRKSIVAVLAGLVLSGCNQAHHDVAQVLRDPSSARFSNEAKGPTGAVCGEVNGKNGFGGYADATPFIYTADHQVKVYGDELKASNMDQLLSGSLALEEFSKISGKIQADCDFVATWKDQCPVAYLTLFTGKKDFCDAYKKGIGEWPKIASPSRSY